MASAVLLRHGVPTVWETSGAAAPTTISFFKGLVAQVDVLPLPTGPPSPQQPTGSSAWASPSIIQRYNAFKAINLVASYRMYSS
jgi:hypothetical protein